MRVLLTTLGSVGDVQPFVALAFELAAHDHQPVFALPSYLLPYAQKYGFESIQIGPDVTDTMLRYIRMEAQGQLTTETRAAYHQTLIEVGPQALKELCALCANAHVLVSSFGMPLGLISHELTGIPYVSVQLCYPLSPRKNVAEKSEVPTAADSLDHPINLFRSQLGLPPISDPDMHGYSPQLALFALSRAILQPQPDWPEHYRLCGFFFVPDESNWQPSSDLMTFLDAGAPPVVISLGSMIHDDPNQLTRLFVDAIKKAGCRAIIQQGWTGLAKNITLPDTIYAIDYVPHSWLFTRAACVIHHGGTGTSAAALRAGCPSIIIPHTFDHFAMAQNALELGYACASFSLKELTAENLSAAIANVFADSSYREVAQRLGKQIRSENGVRQARLLIEDLLRTTT